MGVKTLRVMVILTPTLALPHQGGGGGNWFFSPIKGEGIGFSDTVRLVTIDSPAQGSNTVEPVVLRPSRSICACAASRNGYV